MVRIPPHPHAWGFNGDGDRPTFTPSILVSGWKPTPEMAQVEDWVQWLRDHPEVKRIPGGPSVCHSFVTDGRIQFLADSNHALAGQTVEIPDWPI